MQVSLLAIIKKQKRCIFSFENIRIQNKKKK